MNATERINTLTGAVVDAAFKVHSTLGPGLLESAYEVCLAHELRQRGFAVQRQVEMPIEYEGIKIDAGYRLDLIVENEVVIELKAVQELLPIHEAQLLTYLRLSGMKAGLLINFNQRLLKDGIKRMVNDL
ncbi:MAG: GxxExxY protein [Candidatus Hydrogenedentes bacterium]|nr:GxxExxY protein [Candidatus Hydrogenedentota bacterium]